MIDDEGTARRVEGREIENRKGVVLIGHRCLREALTRPQAPAWEVVLQIAWSPP
jgi:hypothetical protein